MNRLLGELQRLYCPLPGALTADDLAHALAGTAAVHLELATPDGTTRALVFDFTRRSDWPQVTALCQALQDDLELPAPAIAVGAADGFQLWLSLAAPVPLAEARDFLAALRGKYLTDLPAARLVSHPGDANAPVGLVPAFDAASGKWSAFIDPGMGSMFTSESGLDLAPNPERQADMLAALASITRADWQRARASLATVPATTAPQTPAPAAVATSALAGPYRDPHSFLLAVMNDPSAPIDQRIEAAKALLPYFANSTA
ncbi:MAG TPA: hypothetical protein VF096_06780 [Azonexus sp.]